MVLLLYFVLLLALTGHSSALYCVCKDGVGDQALQKALDYACGAGADCTPILQNGACYQPNTVKDHCSYAVNSYFQKRGQAQGSCDFAGTATASQTAPASSSGCVFPSSASSTSTGTGTTTTPSTSPTTGITGTTPSTTTSTTPTSTTAGTTTGTGTGTSSPTFGISPTATTTGTGTSFNDSKGVALLQSTVFPLPLSLLIFWLMFIIRV
ncbi:PLASMODESMATA CALLOSE-BINDING PROTEIN 3-like [Prosopis cineraria]|uniref:PLASMODESMATA CALLOSE-BINDING PROTEIN 3-like n=1 Tax=Prosopis cineraria TaxID=364024 RepID=UPI00240F6674|nr:PLASMODESMATA CALLOSE-BINDING PROTEIN 3-like [Prosopis cineraria]XP_054810448.1 PLASMODESMATA CALLOSE-BINDING PROTEIN 3-like [Prosopis cineraria]